MKHVLIAALWLLGYALPCAAQAGDAKSGARGQQPRPDLSGVWVLDRSLTKYEGDRGGKPPDAETTLLVAHTGPEVRIVSRTLRADGLRTHEAVYYADGRGEKNPSQFMPLYSAWGERRRVVAETATRWKKNRLVTVGVHRVLPSDQIHAHFTDEWELSADGETLTQKTVVRVSDHAALARLFGTRNAAGSMRRDVVRVYKRSR